MGHAGLRQMGALGVVVCLLTVTATAAHTAGLVDDALQPVLLGADRIDLGIDVVAGLVTTAEYRSYHVARAVTYRGHVTFYRSVPEKVDLARATLVVDGEPVGLTLLEPDEADELRLDLVAALGDPAPLREMGSPLLVSEAVDVVRQRGENLEVNLVTEYFANARDTLSGVTVPLEWSPKPIDDLEIQVGLETVQPLRTIYSPFHALETTRAEPNVAEATHSSGGVDGAEPFTLLWSQGHERIHVDLLPFRYGADEGGFFMAMLTSAFVPIKDQLPRDLVFLLDVSGSMGENGLIAQARETLIAVLAGLRPTDHFALITFANDVNVAPLGTVLATPDNVAEGQAWVAGGGTGGGTEMLLGLREAYRALPTTNGHARYIILLTDGQPSGRSAEESQIIRLASANRETAHVHPFGMGDGVNAIFLDRLAAVTNGDARYVRPGQSVSTEVETLFSEIGAPVLSHLAIEYEGFGPPQPYPNSAGPLFNDRPIVVLGRYESGGVGNITLAGSGRGEQVMSHLAVSLPDYSIANGFVPRLWAARRVASLLAQARTMNRIEDEREALAVARRYGVVSRQTLYQRRDDSVELLYNPVSHDTVGAEAIEASQGIAALAKTLSLDAAAIDGVRGAFDRSLPLHDGWSRDSSLRSEPKWTDLHFGSDRYFEFARAEGPSGAGRLLSLGRNVEFEWLGRDIRVTQVAAIQGPAPPESEIIPPPRVTPPTEAAEITLEEPDGDALDDAPDPVPFVGPPVLDRDPGRSCTTTTASPPAASLPAWVLLACLVWVRRRQSKHASE